MPWKETHKIYHFKAGRKQCHPNEGYFHIIVLSVVHRVDIQMAKPTTYDHPVIHAAALCAPNELAMRKPEDPMGK